MYIYIYIFTYSFTYIIERERVSYNIHFNGIVHEINHPASLGYPHPSLHAWHQQRRFIGGHLIDIAPCFAATGSTLGKFPRPPKPPKPPHQKFILRK